MKTTIYYFSGTGNSLYTAKKIAENLDDVEIISVKKAMNNRNLASRSKNIGIVFPVIAWGAPRLVEKFIDTFKFRKDQYIFSVATCGGVSGNTNPLINKRLKKRDFELSAGYVIRAGVYERSNGPTILPIRISQILGKKESMSLRTIDKRIDEISNNIKNRTESKIEKSTVLAGIWGNILHDTVLNVFEKEDKNFWADDNCNNCGMCAKICPSNNISFENNKPKWNGNCQACYGCFQWCPKASIQFKQESLDVKREYNKEISLKEMID